MNCDSKTRQPSLETPGPLNSQGNVLLFESAKQMKHLPKQLSFASTVVGLEVEALIDFHVFQDARVDYFNLDG